MSVLHQPAPAARASIRPAMLSLAASPLAWLGLFLLVAVVALLLPLRLPLGANYWDTAAYLDAVHRVRLGQWPGRDFFAPVGPLGYGLAALIEWAFPRAQPMLVVNWALLPVTLTAMAVLTHALARRSAPLALALTLPFILFAALPVNLHSLYPMPGFDGFGAYNRHGALLLYCLAASLIFAPSRRLRTGLVAALMAALFLTKITGAVAGALLVGFAVLAGRLRIVEALTAAGIVLAGLAVVELTTGLVGFYLADILTLVSLNTGSLLPRILTVASVKANVVLPALALIAILAFVTLRDGIRPTLSGLRALAGSPLGWLAASFAALALYETQNTGSLEFVGLWPALLLVLLDWWQRRDRLRPIVLALVAAVALPSAVIAMERAARALLGAPSYRPLAADAAGPLGRVSLKADIAERAETMLAHYAGEQQAYRDLVRRGVLPSYILYSEIDYQAAWLLELQQGVEAIRAWEAKTGRRLDRLFTLDFADAPTRLLGRNPPRHVAIGIDPGRSNPPLDTAALAELAATDAILEPHCPPTTARSELARHFAPALAGRTVVALSPCWRMHLRP